MYDDYYAQNAQNGNGQFLSGRQTIQNEPSTTKAQTTAYEPWNEDATDRYSKWDPRGWSLKKKLFLAAGIIVVIVAVIVGAVLGVRANRYPDYSKLDYSLKDTYSGSSFFDNFEYFTAADPTHGFVQYVFPQVKVQPKFLMHCLDTSTALHLSGLILHMPPTHLPCSKWTRHIVEQRLRMDANLYGLRPTRHILKDSSSSTLSIPRTGAVHGLLCG